ncbi:hypothetical protein Q3G72_008412 [Acer saccharum]|nr:hypothetical protein Q3G72_008412 [Acer saccharum]
MDTNNFLETTKEDELNRNSIGHVEVDNLETTVTLKPDAVTSKTPMDESSDSSSKSEPYDTVSEGSSSYDSQDGGLVSEDGEPSQSEEPAELHC